MRQGTRRAIGWTVQGLILFLVIGGLMYNASGIRDWFGRRLAHSVTKTIKDHDRPAPAPTSH